MRKRKFLRRLRRMLEDHADTLALQRAAETVDWENTTPLNEVERRLDQPFGYQVSCTCPVRAHGTCLIHDVRVWS